MRVKLLNWAQVIEMLPLVPQCRRPELALLHDFYERTSPLTVYAIEIIDGCTTFRLSGEAHTYPAVLFSVTEAQPSMHWIYSHTHIAVSHARTLRTLEMLSHSEFSANTRAFSALVDQEPESIQRFSKLIDEFECEFPSNHAEYAQLLQECWIMCPCCDEAWEEKRRTGMVHCQKCKTLLNNPCYRSIKDPSSS